LAVPIGTAEEAAEKVAFVTSGAEARIQMKELIAALEALRHPKPDFSSSQRSRVLIGPIFPAASETLPCPKPILWNQF